MQEEREAGEQGHRQAVVWGGAGPSSSPSPHPVSTSGRQAEQASTEDTQDPGVSAPPTTEP